MASQKNTKVDAIERAVLGIFLRDMTQFWKLKDRARPELFFNGIHQRIVVIMHKLADGGAASFEYSLIIGRLGVIDNFDPAGYLYHLVDDAGEPSEAFELIMELEELLAGRKLLDLSKFCQEAATADNDKSMQERLADVMKKLEMVGDRIGAQAVPASQMAERMMAKIYDRFSQSKAAGLRTGLAALDDLMGPALGNRVITIGGPPGSGKTALSWMIAKSFGKTSPGCFFSQEMEGDELTVRDVAQVTGIPGFRIEAGSINLADVEKIADAAALLNNSKIHIDEESGLNHHQIRNRVYRLKRTVGCEWVIIDHLLYCGPTERRQSTIDRVEQNMKGFKFLSKTLKIPVIVLAQLTKEYGKGTWKDIRAPQNNDLLGGSAIEQDSDVVLFVHRPSVLLERREPKEGTDEHASWKEECLRWESRAEISLGKRRGGIGHGTRKPYFHGPTMLFSDQPPADYRQPQQSIQPDIDFGV